MTKEVLINISGLQMDVDPENPIEMVTTGAYYLKMASIIFYMMSFQKIMKLQRMS